MLSTNLNNDNDKLNNNSDNIDNTKNSNKMSVKKVFKIQFTISIIIIISTISFSTYYIYSLKNKEKISENLIGNYNIYKLYTNVEKEDETTQNNLFGIIEIPKINLYYPVFSILTCLLMACWI